MKEIIINHFLNYEFVYIFLFLFLLFFVISMFIKQQIIKKISIVIFSLFFALFCFEFVLSFFMDKNGLNFENFYTNYLDSDNIYKRDEIFILLDNKNKIFLEDTLSINNYSNYEIIYNKKYSIYSNGFRYTKSDINSYENYIFLGGSFVFGGGLSDDETLPYYFSKLYDFKKNIINSAVQGKSSNTALNILNNELFFPLIKNKDSKIKHCFYTIMIDHIYRNFRTQDPSDIKVYKNNKWYIPTTIGRIKYIFSRSYIFRKLFVPIIDEKFKRYYEDYMIQSLEEINKIIEEKYNSKLTIIVWDIEKYSEYFIRELKKRNLDLILLAENFNSEKEGYRIKNDGHPTAKANEIIAEILYNHINKIY